MDVEASVKAYINAKRAAYTRQWRAANRERVRENSKRYYAENRDKFLGYVRKYRAKKKSARLEAAKQK